MKGILRNKKADTNVFWVIIGIVIGLVFLFIVTVGFTSGWGNLWANLKGIFIPVSGLKATEQSCQVSAQVDNKYDFCCRERKVKLENKQEIEETCEGLLDGGKIQIDGAPACGDYCTKFNVDECKAACPTTRLTDKIEKEFCCKKGGHEDICAIFVKASALVGVDFCAPVGGREVNCVSIDGQTTWETKEQCGYES